MGKFYSVIFSTDIITAFCVAFPFYFFTPHPFVSSIFEELTKAGISVFSVVFPLFFAALTTILTASDDDFTTYLEEKGFYREILFTYKYTLILVFIALISSIILNITRDYIIKLYSPQFHILTSIYIFLFVYALFATLNSILDSIQFAKYRGIYLRKTKL